MLFHSHAERFHALHDVKGTRWALAGAEITQALFTGSRDERSGTKLFGEYKVVKTFVGL